MKIFIISILCALFFLAPGKAFAADGRSINNGATLDITDQGPCRRVTNSCGARIFVPTKTLTEFNSFINNGPACAARPNCPINGGFTAWTAATSFQTGFFAVGAAETIETRTCTNPPPQFGGAACSGATSRRRANCETFTLQNTRIGLNTSVSVTLRNNGLVRYAANNTLRTGVFCFTGSSEAITLAKLLQPAAETTFIMNGRTLRFVRDDVGTVLLNNHYRRGFTAIR